MEEDDSWKVDEEEDEKEEKDDFCIEDVPPIWDIKLEPPKGEEDFAPPMSIWLIIFCIIESMSLDLPPPPIAMEGKSPLIFPGILEELFMVEELLEELDTDMEDLVVPSGLSEVAVII
uniref:Uncharacterized protein n=1 Tax=Lepeophtheirus salmonis TaxID=72036 RepID=A0A0K2TNZ4_LEPSM